MNGSANSTSLTPARRVIRYSSRWPIPRAVSTFRASRSPICCARFAPTSNFRGFETHRRSARLLALFGQSGGPAGALSFRLSRRERQHLSDSGMQRTSARQFLAGCRNRPRKGPHLSCRGRTCAKFGVTPRGLARGAMRPRNFSALMRHEVGVARELLVRGAALHRTVDRRLSRATF